MLVVLGIADRDEDRPELSCAVRWQVSAKRWACSRSTVTSNRIAQRGSLRGSSLGLNMNATMLLAHREG